jgi:hypothetical protein
MAAKKGQFAKVMIDVGGTPTEVMKLREWSISVESEKIDTTAAGDEWSEHEIGVFSWEGEATCIDADPYWLDYITEKTQIDFYDDENDANPIYRGTASIDFERTAPYDDVIESTITFTGSGALTHPTTP